MAVVSLIAQVADLKSSQLAGAAIPVMPSGVILPFGGSTAPSGWLLCNGSAISRTTYAELFAAIGTLHGSGDGSTTFHLPDYRGRFLRGADSGAARDPDRATRSAANSGGATGDSVGSVQSNATAKNGLTASSGTQSADHAHTTTTGGASANHGHGIGGDGTHRHINGGFERAQGGGGSDSYNALTHFDWRGHDKFSQYEGWHTHGGGTGGHSVDHGHTGTSGGVNVNHSHSVAVAAGDNETRPHNANVHYIIKI